LRSVFPTAADLRENSTCYWYAMARGAEILSERSPSGYYAFVVSDEEDDPDYVEKGRPGHSLGDYRHFHSHIEPTFPVSEIYGTIGRYFEPKDATGYNWSPRSGFPMTLIARFYQLNSPLPLNRQVRLAWYALGVKPQPVAAPSIPAALVPAALVPPKFHRTISLLGGLENTDLKKFNYEVPLVICQIPYSEATGLSGTNIRLQDGQGRQIPTAQAAGSLMGASPRLNGPRTVRPRLPPGKHTIQVVAEGADGEVVKSRPVEIEIEPRSDWLLPFLAIVCALAAGVIFTMIWFSLRASDAKPKRGRIGTDSLRDGA
jgi:hypothetical protein